MALFRLLLGGTEWLASERLSTKAYVFRPVTKTDGHQSRKLPVARLFEVCKHARDEYILFLRFRLRRKESISRDSLEVDQSVSASSIPIG